MASLKLGKNVIRALSAQVVASIVNMLLGPRAPTPAIVVSIAKRKPRIRLVVQEAKVIVDLKAHVSHLAVVTSRILSTTVA